MDFARFFQYSEHSDRQHQHASNGHDSNTAKIRELTARIGEMEVTVEEQAAHITSLETALTATIRALAFGETTYPGGHPEKHALCGRETAEHLARAAQALGLDLNDLYLAYVVTCPHEDVPALCTACRGIYAKP